VRRVLLQMYMTLDGSTARVDFTGMDSDDGNEREVWTGRYDSIDTLVLGRRAYEDWAAFWPSSQRKSTDPEFFHQHSRFTDRVQKIVFSKTLASAAWPNTRIERGDVAETIAAMKQQPGKDISVGGGATIARALMERDLIDDYLLTIWPVLSGKGPRLFGDMNRQLNLRLVKSYVDCDGVALLHYQPRRAPTAESTL
jgi:dihydrofolate reductase